MVVKGSKVVKFAAFLLTFAGAVLFYAYYGGLTAVDSVLFVVLTISTIGYRYDAKTSYGARLFTTVFMVVGVLFVFTYVRNAVHGFGRSIKQCLPRVKQKNRVLLLTVVTCTVLVVVILLGTLFVALNEGYDFSTSLYFIVYTATTVGYGDVEVKYLGTKVFLIFYALLSPIILAFTFDSILSFPRRRSQQTYGWAVLHDEIPLQRVLVDLNSAQRRAAVLERQREIPLAVRIRSLSSLALVPGGNATSAGDSTGRDVQKVHTPVLAGDALASPRDSTTRIGQGAVNAPDNFQADEGLEASTSDGVLFARSTGQDPGKPLPQEESGGNGHGEGPSIHSAAVEMTKAEFLLSMLLRLGKVDFDADLYVWAKKFDALDSSGTGRLVFPPV